MEKIRRERLFEFRGFDDRTDRLAIDWSREREMDVEVDQVEVDVVEMSMTMLMYRVST
mgnify:CR=1 FL=1